MSKRRDRHERGMRGPLAATSPLTGKTAPIRRRQTAAVFFTECVTDAVDEVKRTCPQALDGVAVGIDEVPLIDARWRDGRVPLAAAVEATEEQTAQVVLYRRPLEHRAATRTGLALLVHRTLVEQLAALTGLDVATIDPAVADEDDD